MPSFNVRVLPDLLSVIMQLAATGILFFVLRHFLFKPVTEFLNERKEGISEDIKKAKEDKEEAQDLKDQYQMKIEEARKESHDIIEAAKQRGEELREQIVEDANEESRKIIEKARREIDSEREKAVDDLKIEVVTLAMMAASKVVDENLDEKSHQKLINQFIDEVGESKWQN